MLMAKQVIPKQSTLKMEEADWKILEALNNNPRLKITELAEKIDMHRNTISAKLMRDSSLDPLRTITKPNYEKLNYTTAYIFATAASNVNNRDTGEKIAKLEGVEEVCVISGEWDFIIKIRAISIEQIGSTIIEELKKFCDKTVTAFSFWSFEGSKPYDLIRGKDKN
jgi:DNA-binding Lrp family transcriptional regulator